MKSNIHIALKKPLRSKQETSYGNLHRRWIKSKHFLQTSYHTFHVGPHMVVVIPTNIPQFPKRFVHVIRAIRLLTLKNFTGNENFRLIRIWNLFGIHLLNHWTVTTKARETLHCCKPYQTGHSERINSRPRDLRLLETN
jgi:hypothetical protein